MGELIVNGIKWAFIIGLALTFAVAINTLLSLLGSLVLGNIVGEILGIISNCLPFSASTVFGAMATTMSAILAFIVARKIYDLTSEHIKI